MHLLPAKIKTSKNKVNIKNEINFFYICLFTITVLFLTTFALKLRQINTNVLGTKTESVVDEVEISKQVKFWKEFTLQNPTYYEGWVELYNLTGESSYLNKAKEIDPNHE